MIGDFVNWVAFPVVFVLLVAGFALLIKGADFFVEGSSSVAKRLRVPGIIIGLTVVAMGTSLPETAVSVTASIAGNNALAISNAIGSNIFNMMVVIGVCAAIVPVMVDSQTIKRDIPFSAACAGLLVALGLLSWANDASILTTAKSEYELAMLATTTGKTEEPIGILGHLDGAIFLVIFVMYLVFLVRQALATRKAELASGAKESEDEIKLLSVPRSILYIVFGGVAIALGGDLTVEAASRIAINFGMSQTLVGLTIVSIGTSLPELVTSITAARKNQVDMALGNAIGSNVFNILMVLGIASAISPIALIWNNIIDIIVLLVFTAVVWIFAITKKRISRIEGLIMLALYVGYAVYIIIR